MRWLSCAGLSDKPEAHMMPACLVGFSWGERNGLSINFEELYVYCGLGVFHRV